MYLSDKIRSADRVLARLSQLEGVAAREGALDGHRGQKVCTTELSFSYDQKPSAPAPAAMVLPSLIRAWHLKNITATDLTLICPAVKSLGPHYRHFGASVPLFKRLGGRLIPKNSRF